MNRVLTIICLVISSMTIAQDLTGRWVAVTSYDSGYYAELYLVQNDENIYAGHCYDTEQGGYCRHWLDAKFYPQTLELVGLDMELISKSPSHAPTDYILKYEKSADGKEYLVGTSAILPYDMRPYMLGIPNKDDLYMLRFRAMQGANYVRYVKVEDNYKIYDEEMPLAMTPDQIMLEKAAFPEIYDDNVDITQPTPPTPEQPKIIKPEPEKPKLNIEKNKEIPPVESNEPNLIDKKPTILEKRKARTDRLLSHVTVETDKVTLLIRDYGTVDNDSVTVFYNDKILVENLKIESDAAVFELELLPHQRNELVFVANNLGDVPPNTAKITLIADKKRYNYKLFTDEENNALILLENIER